MATFYELPPARRTDIDRWYGLRHVLDGPLVSVPISEDRLEEIDMQARDLWVANRDDIVHYLGIQGFRMVEGITASFPTQRHSGSEARYLVEERIDEDRKVFVSFLPPGVKTSIHYHDQGEEDYLLLSGEAKVNGLTLTNTPLTIETGLVHQARTENSSAFLLIVMRGIKGVPDDQIHTRLGPEAEQYVGRNAHELAAQGVLLPRLR